MKDFYMFKIKNIDYEEISKKIVEKYNLGHYKDVKEPEILDEKLGSDLVITTDRGKYKFKLFINEKENMDYLISVIKLFNI